MINIKSRTLILTIMVMVFGACGLSGFGLSAGRVVGVIVWGFPMQGYCSKGEDKRGLGFWGSGCRDYRLGDFSVGW